MCGNKLDPSGVGPLSKTWSFVFNAKKVVYKSFTSFILQEIL